VAWSPAGDSSRSLKIPRWGPFVLFCFVFLKADRKAVFPVAFSGIAAQLLKGGRTDYAGFRLPRNPMDNFTTNIEGDSAVAALLRDASVLWDEAPMLETSLSCFGMYLKRYNGLHTRQGTLEVCPFGGKMFVMAGDFRQVRT